MPRNPPASSTRARRVLIAVVTVPALAAGAIWLRSAARLDSSVTAVAQQPAASAAPAPPAPPRSPDAAPATDAMTATPAKPSTTAPETFAPAAAGQQAHIDPKTGRLREREHDDAPAAAQAAPRRAGRTATIQSESAPQEFLGPGGAVGVTVPEELHTALVATRLPDGRIVFEHAAGPKAAGAKVRKDAAKTPGVKEERNDR
jgi:hypothetical protein